ncbi:MAG: hypothetical protein Q4D73_07505 [Actinomycetaceae bacterium]|nr:hypothetical protein [Actinomycetaceae bacterium]
MFSSRFAFTAGWQPSVASYTSVYTILSIPLTFGFEVMQVSAVFAGGRWSLDFEMLQDKASSMNALVLCIPWNPPRQVLSKP